MTDLLMTQGGRNRMRDAVEASERGRNAQVARRAGSDEVRNAMIQALIAQGTP